MNLKSYFPCHRKIGESSGSCRLSISSRPPDKAKRTKNSKFFGSCTHPPNFLLRFIVRGCCCYCSVLCPSFESYPNYKSQHEELILNLTNRCPDTFFTQFGCWYRIVFRIFTTIIYLSSMARRWPVRVAQAVEEYRQLVFCWGRRSLMSDSLTSYTHGKDRQYRLIC
jgi:hypothetical protein